MVAEIAKTTATRDKVLDAKLSERNGRHTRVGSANVHKLLSALESGAPLVNNNEMHVNTCKSS